MTHQEELDYLFSKRKREGSSMSKFFNQLFTITGAIVILCLVIIAALIYNGFPILERVLNQEDVLTSVSDQKQNLALRQFFRYCKPDILHRIGNGYDEGTCKQKLQAMSLSVRGGNGDNEDTQAMINDNLERFMASKGE